MNLCRDSTICQLAVVLLLSIGQLALGDDADIRQITKELQDGVLHETKPVYGHVRQQGEKVEFESHCNKTDLQFTLIRSKERFQVALKGTATVQRMVSEVWQSEPSLDATKTIPGTDIAFEDVAFRFLFWSHVSGLGNSFIRTRHCVGLRFMNDGTQSNYRYVDLWIDRDSDAPLRAIFYGKDGNALKQFEVIRFANKEIRQIRVTDLIKEQKSDSYIPEYLEFSNGADSPR